MNIILYILIGIAAGVMSGLVGLGGGTLIIPALVYFLGFTQLQAQGTTLAIMVPPIGILAAWVYYRSGHVNIPTALFICLGFVVGGYFGARFATGLSNEILRKTFGIFLLLVALHMIFKK